MYIFIKNTFNESIRVDKFIADTLKVSRYKVEQIIFQYKVHSKTKNNCIGQKSFKVLKNEIIKINNIESDIEFNISDKILDDEFEKYLDANNIILFKDNNYYKIDIVVQKNKINHQAELIDIIYEDQDIIVIDKKAGQIVYPGFGCSSKTLLGGVLNHLTQKSNKDTEIATNTCYCNECDKFIFASEDHMVVHRIDKDTTGLIVFAKNICAFNILKKQFFYKKAKRTYLVAVHGVPNEREGVIDVMIKRGKFKDKKMVIALNEDEDAKQSITNYKVISVSKDMQYSLLKCKLKTGRTHQIRVHMQYINHAVVGDQKYYIRKKDDFFKRQALHAFKLELIHPRNKNTIDFTSNIPNEMIGLCEKLNIEYNKDNLV